MLSSEGDFLFRNTRYIFYEDALAAYEVDELWTETLSESELAQVELHSVFSLLEELGTRAKILRMIHKKYISDSFLVKNLAVLTKKCIFAVKFNIINTSNKDSPIDLDIYLMIK